MNIKNIKKNTPKPIYNQKIKNSYHQKKKIKSQFFKIVNKILNKKINKKKDNFLNINKIKLNEKIKKIKQKNYLGYKDKCIELNQEGLWIKTLTQIRKKLISAYEEIINMPV
ncbi:flagellar hook-basal body complex protein FliE [Buchnera aphidicola]|uniref:flagellar hook-basal body complex protein FliE n=1 Tax=Buchnera aphidicola TaxID=9 RepID=UPI00094DB5CF|nr:flagellar hook-basal body complex protein FliE [Buchnera aphidicola]